MNPILVFALDHVLTLKFLDGYRSYAAGAFLMLGGLATFAHEFATGTFDSDTTQKAFAAVTGGLAIIGAAGKADRITNALKATNGK